MLTFIYTLSVIGMVLLPLILAGAARRRFRPPWLLFAVGMLTFGLSQAGHIPFNNWLVEIGWLPAGAATGTQPLWRNALTLGLSAGLFEELLRVFGYAVLQRFPALRSQTTAGGLMLGLGHGGIESMVFGGVLTAASVAALLPLIGGDLATLNLLPEQLTVLQRQLDLLVGSPWYAVLPFVERLLAIGLQSIFSLMVLRAFQRRQPAWVVLAIAYHALIDAALVVGVATIENALLIEALLALLSLPGLAWLFQQIKGEHAGTPSFSMRRDLAVLGAALSKELLQQVRTGRLLAVGVVLGLFGMLSPLLAYLTPQLLNMIPGAEAFASLIPPPTAGDAIVQYHKNLTQFGLMIVLLLGMGAVAGEKERGVAALILSKPLTRWAFLLSKFLAQTVALGIGFIVAMVGAYSYTAYLFAPPDFLQFGAMNLVLFAWLLPYLAVVLLGSVLGKSTSAGAGFGLAGTVGLMGLSSVPIVAGIMPGALSAWAVQLGNQAVGIEPGAHAAAGSSPAALVMSLIIVLGCFIVALGAFEQQEL